MVPLALEIKDYDYDSDYSYDGSCELSDSYSSEDDVFIDKEIHILSLHVNTPSGSLEFVKDFKRLEVSKSSMVDFELAKPSKRIKRVFKESVFDRKEDVECIFDIKKMKTQDAWSVVKEESSSSMMVD